MSEKDIHEDLNAIKTLNLQGIFLHLSTKEDLFQAKSELRTEIATLKEDMTGLRTELKEDMTSLKTELKEEIYEVRSSLKWANRFMITTLAGVILGLIKVYFPHI